jgi:hypothetical protein
VIKIEKNEMGGACSAYGGEAYYRVLVGKREGKRGVDGRIILRWILRQYGLEVWTG